jgi:hypothetical protein
MEHKIERLGLTITFLPMTLPRVMQLTRDFQSVAKKLKETSEKVTENPESEIDLNTMEIEMVESLKIIAKYSDAVLDTLYKQDDLDNGITMEEYQDLVQTLVTLSQGKKK